MFFFLDRENRNHQQMQREAEIATMFDGTITLIASSRCYGIGSGKQRRHCSHHLNLSPASPEETVTRAQAKNFACHHEWQRRRRDGHQVWICPVCL